MMQVETDHGDGQPWLVVGASGFVGSAVVAALTTAGIPVRTVSAPRVEAEPGGEPCALAAATVDHPALPALAAAMHGVAVVVMAAGRAEPDATWTSGLVGANAFAPALVARAAHLAGVPRLIHLSSAAVQGRARTLTEDDAAAPFSPYSRSKVRGEQALIRLADETGLEVVILRATSVQGATRATTQKLRRVARSALASVAGDGRQPSAVSSVQALSALVVHVGRSDDVPPTVLQPWEGLSVAEVLKHAGGREPRRLPGWACTAAVTAGYALTRSLGGRGAGAIRRVEAMWFGQRVEARWASETGFRPPAVLAAVLHGDRA